MAATPNSNSASAPASESEEGDYVADGKAVRRKTMVFYEPARTAHYNTTDTVDKEHQGNLMYSNRESELLQDIFHAFITKTPAYVCNPNVFVFYNMFSVLLEFFHLCENKDQWEELSDSLLTMTFARSTTLM